MEIALTKLAPPSVDPVLLTTLMALYATHSGFEIAEAIKIIRQYLDQQQSGRAEPEPLETLRLHTDEIWPGEDED
jgi:hypothetical protein